MNIEEQEVAHLCSTKYFDYIRLNEEIFLFSTLSCNSNSSNKTIPMEAMKININNPFAAHRQFKLNKLIRTSMWHHRHRPLHLRQRLFYAK